MSDKPLHQDPSSVSSASSVVDRYVLLGLAIMIVSEAATLAKIEPFWSWNTPIAWTGFLIFADAVVWRARRDSWVRSAPREFALLALASIPLWVLFEGYNLVIRNWHYIGLPENTALRYFGYAWSFATIWPAIFLGAELLSVVRNVRETYPPVLPTPPDLPALPALLSVAAATISWARPGTDAVIVSKNAPSATDTPCSRSPAARMAV
jgi:hypothetical protein